jgi:cytochrome P450
MSLTILSAERAGAAVRQALRIGNRAVRKGPGKTRAERVSVGVPYVGNLLAFAGDRLWLLQQMASVPGGICEAVLLREPAVFVSSPELAHEVLVTQAGSFLKGTSYEFLKPMIGKGLLTNEREHHRKQRQLMAPSFAARRVSSYADTMAALTEDVQSRWADGARIDVSEEMMRLTLAIVSKTLLDADTTADTERVADAVSVLVSDVNQRMTVPMPPLHWPTPGNNRARAALKTLDEIIYGIIAERRRDGTDHGDLLSMLLAAREEGGGGGMDDKQLRDEAMTIFLAGHETTATGLAWSFYLLGRHPQLYKKLREQARSVLGGRSPTFTDLPKLGYAMQVFKEAMRLYPPAYAMGRRSTEEVTIGDVRIPPMTEVVVNTYGMHHDAKLFPDPERFDPDRFEPGAEKQIPKGAYLPFGGGARVCIGNHFALMEGQLILADLAQRVELSPVSLAPIEADPMVTLRPLGPVPMTVRRLG